MSLFSRQHSRKRKFLLLIPIFIAVSLFAAACGSDDDDDGESVSAATDAPSAPVATEAPAEEEAMTYSVGLVYDLGGRGDGTFNDSAFRGLTRAAEELGIQATDVSPNEDGTNRGELLELQADNQDLVIGVGFAFGGSILEAAQNNPDTYFAIVDGGPSDDSPDNLAHLLFAEHEGSCMVGAIAALKTTTVKVGFIGGVRNPLIQRFEAGYSHCIGVVDSQSGAATEVMVDYISEAGDFSGFNDPARAKIIAAKMYEDGADIIFHAAGGSGGGLFLAAKEHSESTGSKVWAIGVDSDEYNTVGDDDLRQYILTSMLKRVDNAVYNIIQDVTNEDFEGGPTPIEYNLANGGVGYSTSGGFVDDIVGSLSQLEAAIGTLVMVPTIPASVS